MELAVQQVLEQGVAAHKAGKLQDAEQLYRAILKVQPSHADANHNLGVLAVAVGKADVALPFFKNALQTNPSIEQFWLSYIDALTKEQQFKNARQVLEQARKQGFSGEEFKFLEAQLSSRSEIKKVSAENPNQEELNTLLKSYQDERYGDAETLALSITQTFPKHQFGWKVLAAVLRRSGKIFDAVNANKKAVELSPKDAEAHSNLGNALKELGRLNEAEASCTQAIVLDPYLVEAHNNLGNVLQEQGKLDKAEVSYAQAIALKPDYANAHNNLGSTLQELGRLSEAEASCVKAIALKPDYADAHNNLGSTLKEQGRLAEAEASFVKAIALKPDSAIPHNNLGNTLKEQGRFSDAETSFLQAIALKPDYAKFRSNLLMHIGSMQFGVEHYQAYARDYSEMAREKAGLPFIDWPSREQTESLRIGFVSGDFGSHPVGYFLEGLLAQLQSSPIELIAYPTCNRQDDQTARRLKSLFQSWCPLVGVSDEAAARKIRDDGIHILIDLSGHTAHNRLPVFAWKPAPIQVTWLGYFASTGLPAMDYILGDPHVTPYEESGHFVEKIWQLPESYLCFTPPKFDLKVNDLPALSKQFVTFGCFNKLSRMTDAVVSVWASILHAVPDSKLFLKDKQLDYQAGRRGVFYKFSAHGITSDRLILEGQSTREEYLACYQRIDIALSPFPYGGGTTSAEGLWMGVPIVAKKGNFFLSHLGESIAYNSGLSGWLAGDDAEYVAKAVQFSSDLAALAALRAGLREQVLRSPLFDAPRFALHFERAVWAMRESLHRTL